MPRKNKRDKKRHICQEDDFVLTRFLSANACSPEVCYHYQFCLICQRQRPVLECPDVKNS